MSLELNAGQPYVPAGGVARTQNANSHISATSTAFPVGLSGS
jgi:hypothetical protein